LADARRDLAIHLSILSVAVGEAIAVPAALDTALARLDVM
jgi:hypothetical protein